MTNVAPVAAPSSNRDPAHPINPAPEFARLRADKPVLKIQRKMPTGQLTSMWMVTRYADVRELLGSSHTSNAFARGESAPAMRPVVDSSKLAA